MPSLPVVALPEAVLPVVAWSSAGRSLSAPSSHVVLTVAASRAAWRARTSMSGSGSTPTTAPTRAASGRLDWPVPQPRSTTVSSASRPNAPTRASSTSGG